MAENDKSKQSSTPKVRDSRGQVNEGRKVDISSIKAYQPIVDRTTTPPPAKGDDNKK